MNRVAVEAHRGYLDGQSEHAPAYGMASRWLSSASPNGGKLL